MGQSQSISTQIDIAAPPFRVRSTFMNFENIPTYHKDWKIVPLKPNQSSQSLQPGDSVKVTMGGMSFLPVINEISNDKFVWTGSLPFIFTGQHKFYFANSQATPGGTTFVQQETFSGLLAFLMGEGWSMRTSTIKGWRAFDESLKRECEK
ncbi:hypothetical protein LTR66_017269 [Elasticomyces elasticus]|nr:hypothetical protein LTR66_017269 [Elasticomyces elasticus]